MASNNLWTIIRAIQHGGEITPRQVRQLLGCNSKKACRLLEHLVSVGAVKNIGKPRHPVFVMQPGGESRIKPISVARQNPVITPKFAARTGRAIRFTKFSGAREYERFTEQHR
ncbi:hypothetical protein EKN76_10935 [Enterobacter bugandensis]|uniref:hypothetical protein n=1 Tax=Enterobacter bugandensis TaxID=881260 RepID=UPI000F822354|nr:hypothetical protein [Enterobacter bugandensis]RTO14943.1 hypothetical protein EKN76_10935 [Enterobacter bugandensis]HCM9595282.1 hypothetical protein [Enterobacter bugandensis]